MNEGTEIKRCEERNNDYLGVEFFPNKNIFLTVTHRSLAYLIEEKMVRHKFTLDNKTSLTVPISEELLRGEDQPDEEKEENKETSPKEFDVEAALEIDKTPPLPACLAVSQKKFAIGWKNSGIIGLYEICFKDIDKVEIYMIKLFTMGIEYQEIMSLKFNKSSDYLAIAGRKPISKREVNEFESPKHIETPEEELAVDCYLANLA